MKQLLTLRSTNCNFRPKQLEDADGENGLVAGLPDCEMLAILSRKERQIPGIKTC